MNNVSSNICSMVNSMVYAARSKDSAVLQSCASGGVFAELARSVLAEDGLVVGCAWNTDDMTAKHVIVSKVEDIGLLAGSKYVMSNICGLFPKIHRIVETGRLVLFSGMPCQVAALRRFLCCDYPNLICVELFCHGVALPDVWDSYKRQLGKKIRAVNFKDKSISWIEPMVRIEFDDGEVICESLYTNEYGVAFQSGFSLLEQCHECRYKGGRSRADISLGDYWGVDRWHPVFSDNKGCNAVIVNTPRGVALWNKTIMRLDHVSSSLEKVLEKNPHYITSAKRPSNKDYFLRNYKSMRMKNLVLQCMRGSLVRRITNKVIRLFGA